MEKFSAYRDAGTGIQPFLTPVPPLGSEGLSTATLPLRIVLGAVRAFVILILTIVYVAIVEGFFQLLAPISFLHSLLRRTFAFIILRLILLVAGVVWISVENVTRKRGRNARGSVPWKPRAGDIIVSNWASWIEILWLTIRFDPIFVLPVTDNVEPPHIISAPAPVTHTPGRRTGTGSANVSTPTRAPSKRIPIHSFRRVSMMTLLATVGHVPPYSQHEGVPESLENIRKDASRPLVVFPECTTSNGRALLRFTDVFKGVKIPVMAYQIFVMCVRYDPPTALAPSPTLSIPSTLNPLPHIFTLASALAPVNVSIRLLSPAESPSSGDFLLSDVISSSAGDDLSEASAALVAQLGKMKRTNMGWEDKASFLEFFRTQKK